MFWLSLTSNAGSGRAVVKVVPVATFVALPGATLEAGSKGFKNA